MITHVELAEKMMAEVVEDALRGVVPMDVANFADLHNHVPENRYGGVAILDDLAGTPAGLDSDHIAALGTFRELVVPATKLVDTWIKGGGVLNAVADEFERRKQGTVTTALLDIDKLIAIEGDEPCLSWRYSLNEFLGGALSPAQLHEIATDRATIAHWHAIYLPYFGREEQLLGLDAGLISVWKPAIEGHLIADGFHRLAAAKIAGLRAIGARRAQWFPNL